MARSPRIRLAKAIVIAAPQSGSGKTVLTLGLLRALKRRGVKVASAKVGPDYIDPAFHAAASRSRCFNLDPWAMPPGFIAHLVADLGRDAELIVIEGVMGLFDGPGSTADLAALLDVPVILAIDAARMAQSAGALVGGFAHHRDAVRIAGVLLNRVGSDRHEAILRQSIALPVLGAIRRDARLELPSRHLGLLQAAEMPSLESFIEDTSMAIERAVDLDQLMALASPPRLPAPSKERLPPLGQRIAVARDEAFAFAYSHLLQGWREQGATIDLFSPLADEAPRERMDAIYLPGGYPELHAGRLSVNGRFLDGMRDAARRGVLVYGECGGYMVLGRSLTDADGRRHEMAGLLPVDTSFAARKLSLGYRELTPLSSAPWSRSLRGHEFHYSTIASENGEPLFAARDAQGNDLGRIGSRIGSVMGSYAHVIA
jgi:cobyrinic acid a,c-diamide synthase